MGDSNKPLGLKKWIDKLSHQDLPVFPNTGRKLLIEVGASNISLAKLAQRVSVDPVLSFHVIKTANGLNPNKETEIYNIEHCVTLLGLKRVKRIAKTIPVMKYSHKSIADTNYVGAIIRSIFSAHLAKHWSELKHHYSSHEVYVASLLYGSSSWALWRFAAKDIRNMEHLIFKQGKSLDQAEQEIFGCRLQDLIYGLACQWRLPLQIREALNPAAQLENKFLANISRAPLIDGYPRMPDSDRTSIAFCSTTQQIIFANRLSNEYDINWYSKHSHRTIKFVSAILKQHVYSTYQQSQQIALNISRLYPMKGLQMPASKLIMPPNSTPCLKKRISPIGILDSNHANAGDDELVSRVANKLTRSKFSEKRPQPTQPKSATINSADRKANSSTSTSTSSENKKPNSKAEIIIAKIQQHHKSNSTPKVDEGLLQALTKYLLKYPQNFKNKDQILALSTQALPACLGLQRSAILQFKAERNEFKVSHLVEQRPSGIKNLSFAMQQDQFFCKLNLKPTGLWLNHTNITRVSPLIPEHFKQLIKVEEFILMSLFSQNAFLGILYADQGTTGEKISQYQYKAFKYLCDAINKTLEQVN